MHRAEFAANLTAVVVLVASGVVAARFVSPRARPRAWDLLIGALALVVGGAWTMSILLDTARLRVLVHTGAVGALAVDVVTGPSALATGGVLLVAAMTRADAPTLRKRAAQFGAIEIVCAIFLAYYAASAPLLFRFLGLGAVADRVMR